MYRAWAFVLFRQPSATEFGGGNRPGQHVGQGLRHLAFIAQLDEPGGNVGPDVGFRFAEVFLDQVFHVSPAVSPA